MTSTTKLGIGGLLGLALAAVAGPREAAAQEADGMAPVRCYAIVNDRGVSSQSAIELCAGAVTEGPAICMIDAMARQPLTSEQAIRLCHGSTTTEPLACYEDLDERGNLTQDQIIAYCAMTCPVGPPPVSTNDVTCLQVAMDETSLTHQQAGALCFGSYSTAAVDCYLEADEEFALADQQLIQLCAYEPACQYVVPAVYYY